MYKEKENMKYEPKPVELTKEQLEDLVADAYAWIARTLGETWSFLVWFWTDPTRAVMTWLSPLLEPLFTFAGDCLDFWYNIWWSR